MRARTGKLRRATAVATAVMAAALAAAQSAGAVERVVDGGFDASTCSASGCTSSVWSQSVVSRDPGEGFGPICTAIAYAGRCTVYSSGYFSSPAWARVGAAFDSADANESTRVTSSVQQPVSIPAAPATLTFQLRIIQNACGPESKTLVVMLDGTTVFSAHQDTAGYGSYKLVSLDVSALAGGTRALRFEATAHAFDSGCPTSGFDIDDVSLNAPPPPDADGDGIPDASDTCPSIGNPNQANSDGDSQGDVCDPDDDNDRVLDAVDACPTRPAASASGCPSSRGSDATPPSASLAGSKRQRLGKSISVVVRCTSTSEDCIADASGRLSVPGEAKVFRPKAVKNRLIRRGTERKLKLQLSKKAQRAARRALRKGKKVRANITIVVRDRSGNRRTLRRKIQLKLPGTR